MVVFLWICPNDSRRQNLTLYNYISFILLPVLISLFRMSMLYEQWSQMIMILIFSICWDLFRGFEELSGINMINMMEITYWYSLLGMVMIHAFHFIFAKLSYFIVLKWLWKRKRRIEHIKQNLIIWLFYWPEQLRFKTQRNVKLVMTKQRIVLV